jgi:hypothetical protein
MPELDPDCPLCEAAKITEWFHEDELCWIAECEICATPMVVWKAHDNRPPAEIKADLHARLATVWDRLFDIEHYVDDNMRQIPDHYHAHARPKGGFFGHSLVRKPV